MSKTTVVTTSINVPRFLTAYSDDAIRYGREVDFIVIGDQKTPSEAKEFCLTIPNCNYMDIQAQQEYMHRFPELWEHIPFNSFERRDIGILKAYENGADTMITIDDDNLLAVEDALRWHQIVGSSSKMPIYRSTSGWFNVCSLLEEENDVEFYHRGYSPKNKWKPGYQMCNPNTGKIVINAGLWYNNPDTDAITRIERPLNVIGFGSDKHDCGTIGLAPGTWSPFNCQNTAIAREVLPSYFMSPYIGRHSDIFASYVVARLAEHFGDVIAFGMPLANHDRSEHNLWHDLEIEKWGMQHTDEFCDVLRSARLTATTYHEGFGQLIEHLKWAASFQKVVEGMQIWHDVFKRII
jgi:hypothetical protein